MLSFKARCKGITYNLPFNIKVNEYTNHRTKILKRVLQHFSLLPPFLFTCMLIYLNFILCMPVRFTPTNPLQANFLCWFPWWLGTPWPFWLSHLVCSNAWQIRSPLIWRWCGTIADLQLDLWPISLPWLQLQRVSLLRLRCCRSFEGTVTLLSIRRSCPVFCSGDEPSVVFLLALL